MEKALEVNDFLHIGMEVGLLLNAADDLLKERLVDELFDAAHGEMGHKVLPVAEIAEVVEGVEDIRFEVIERLGFILHAQPEHSWGVVAAEDACAVEVHGEGLVPLGHLLTGLDDLRDILIGGVAHEFQGEMDLVGFAPVDVATLVFQVSLEALGEDWELGADGDGDGEESSFHITLFYQSESQSVEPLSQSSSS